MEQNYLICHKEIADMGYYFLDREQEALYLKGINDEFALRVGKEMARRIPEDKRSYVFSLPEEEMLDYLRENVPDIEETVKEIKEKLLEEVRESRRFILGESANISNGGS